MKSVVPKQFLCLAGVPIIMRSINAFRDFDKEMNIVLVLPKDQTTTWQKLCDEYQYKEQVLIAEGGDTRFQSVKNGLKHIKDDEGLIAVHDAVRPLVTNDIINNAFKCAAEKRNGSALH